MDSAPASEDPKSLSGTTRVDQGLATISQRLNEGETVSWHAGPMNALLLLELLWKSLMWWTIFPCLGFMNEQALETSMLMMAMLGLVDFKQRKHGAVYVITNERAFLGNFRRNGDLKVEEYNLRDLVSVKKTPFTRTIKLKFKGVRKWVRFPCVEKPQPAVDLLLQSLKR